jgi:4-amino-4-deoxy-L-arabinose transferase-like glycosyltransferase
MIRKFLNKVLQVIIRLFNWFWGIFNIMLTWFSRGNRWEKSVLTTLALSLPFLFLYNLGNNPRPWHDEGSYLSVARTLVEHGKYAVWNIDGYQTFGPIQSAGPILILPIALAFKLFGVGLVQGRIVTGIASILTVILFYFVASKLFDRLTGLVAIVILLSSPASNFILYGRQVLGEVPAFGWFLAGWLMLSRGIQKERFYYFPLSGLCFGAAILTKSQYLLILVLVFALLAVLDLLFYRIKCFWPLVFTLIVMLSCYCIWMGWQYIYYGKELFLENAGKLRELASVTTYISPIKLVSILRYYGGTGSGHLFLFWGFPALILSGFLSMKKSKEGLIIGFLFLFTVIYLLYLIFILPWSLYYLAPTCILTIFIAWLFVTLAKNLQIGNWNTFREIIASTREHGKLSMQSALWLGTLVGLLSFGLWTGYQLQTRIHDFVIDRDGFLQYEIIAPLDYTAPSQAIKFLDGFVKDDQVIETWERELGIISNFNFHYPDQSLLTPGHAAIFRGGKQDYRLSESYFQKIKPSYLIIGWFARHFQIYDPEYLADHATLLTIIGQYDWKYEIYKMDSQTSTK